MNRELFFAEGGLVVSWNKKFYVEFTVGDMIINLYGYKDKKSGRARTFIQADDRIKIKWVEFEDEQNGSRS